MRRRSGESATAGAHSVRRPSCTSPNTRARRGRGVGRLAPAGRTLGAGRDVRRRAGSHAQRSSPTTCPAVRRRRERRGPDPHRRAARAGPEAIRRDRPRQSRRLSRCRPRTSSRSATTRSSWSATARPHRNEADPERRDRPDGRDGDADAADARPDPDDPIPRSIADAGPGASTRTPNPSRRPTTAPGDAGARADRRRARRGGESASKRKGRSSVPSWDEIMFGGGKRSRPSPPPPCPRLAGLTRRLPAGNMGPIA